MENRKINFGNRRINQQRQQQPHVLLKQNPQQNPQQYFSVNNNSNIIIQIIIFIFFVIIMYLVYTYWNEIYDFIKNTEGSYLVIAEEEEKEKIKCRKGCIKGICVKGKTDGCIMDSECKLCVDNKGGFYGNVYKYNEDLEEEEIIERRRMKDLEDRIERRNNEISDLNKYIDYVNVNKDKINKDQIKKIFEEEEKNKLVINKKIIHEEEEYNPFIIKINHS